MRNNIVHHCSTGIWLISAKAAKVYNNVVYQNDLSAYGGIRVQDNENIIRHNTVGSSINVTSGVTLVTVQNNIVYPGTIIIPTAGISVCNNNTSTGSVRPFVPTIQPLILFLSMQRQGIFNFKLSSPAIGTGLTLGAPYNVDILGVSKTARYCL